MLRQLNPLPKQEVGGTQTEDKHQKEDDRRPALHSVFASLSNRKGGKATTSVNLEDLPFCTKTTLLVITRALLLLMMHTWLFEMFLESEAADSFFRHYHSCKRPLYNTCVITFFVIVHSATINPQSTTLLKNIDVIWIDTRTPCTPSHVC